MTDERDRNGALAAPPRPGLTFVGLERSCAATPPLRGTACRSGRSATASTAFFDAVGDFFGSLAAIQWLALFPALFAFGVYLTLRARASFNILRAAYPDERIQFRYIWGAYMAATASTASCRPAAATSCACS